MPARRRNHRDPTAAIGDLRTELRAQRREIQRLRTENEVLHEAAEPLIHHAPARERFVFIHRLRTQFSIRRLRRTLVTDHSNYHAWIRAKARRYEHAHNPAGRPSPTHSPVTCTDGIFGTSSLDAAVGGCSAP